MIDRLPWWERYTDTIPVVIGHYWRNFKTTEEKSGLFKHIDACNGLDSSRMYLCDYSVGRRYRDRQQQAEFAHHLGALRWPENLVILKMASSISLKNDVKSSHEDCFLMKLADHSTSTISKSWVISTPPSDSILLAEQYSQKALPL